MFVSLLQQADSDVSIWSQRGGAISLPHLEGVLWSLAFPLLGHTNQGEQLDCCIERDRNILCWIDNEIGDVVHHVYVISIME